MFFDGCFLGHALDVKSNGERAPLPYRAFEFDAAAILLGDLAHDRKAEPNGAGRAQVPMFDLHELIENTILIFFCYSHARVLDGERELPVRWIPRRADRYRSATGR